MPHSRCPLKLDSGKHRILWRREAQRPRMKVVVKPVAKTKAPPKSKPAAVLTVTRSKAARSNITEGTGLYTLAGRPTKAQFVKVYGAKGPAMTWEQRAAAGVPAEKFQEALKTKLGKQSASAVAVPK
jgi:hypothetical protein